jgi:hypothetical protein
VASQREADVSAERQTALNKQDIKKISKSVKYFFIVTSLKYCYYNMSQRVLRSRVVGEDSEEMDLGSGESYQEEQYAQPDEFEYSLERVVVVSPEPVQEAEISANTQLDSPADPTTTSKQTDAETSKVPSFDLQVAFLSLQEMMQAQSERLSKDLQDKLSEKLDNQSKESKEGQDKLSKESKEIREKLDSQAKEL